MLDQKAKSDYIDDINEDYEEIRAYHYESLKVRESINLHMYFTVCTEVCILPYVSYCAYRSVLIAPHVLYHMDYIPHIPYLYVLYVPHLMHRNYAPLCIYCTVCTVLYIVFNDSFFFYRNESIYRCTLLGINAFKSIGKNINPVINNFVQRICIRRVIPFFSAEIPTFLGTKAFIDYDLERLIPYIDWKPFFDVWQLRGKYPNRGYPKLFNDPDVGPEAKKVYDEAQGLLKKILADGSLKASGVVAFYPAQSRGDDILLFSPDNNHSEPLAILHGLR